MPFTEMKRKGYSGRNSSFIGLVKYQPNMTWEGHEYKKCCNIAKEELGLIEWDKYSINMSY